MHLIADLFLRLLQQIKARQNFTIALRNAIQYSLRDLCVLPVNRGLFRVAVHVYNPDTRVQTHLLAAVMYGLIDMRSYLPPDYCAHKSYEPFRFAEFSPANR